MDRPPYVHLSRRQFLHRVGVAGAGATFLPMLSACGLDDDDVVDAPDAADPTPTPEDAELTIRYATGLSADDPSSRAMQAFRDYVHEEGGGRIAVEVFDSGALGGLADLVDQVEAGAIAMAHAGASYFQTIVPEAILLTLPYLFRTREQAYSVVDGDVGEQLGALYEAHGFKVLGWHDTGIRHVWNNQGPIHTPDDLRGLRLRVSPNPAHLDAFEVLGATPDPMDYGEVYSALEQGVVDGFEGPLGSTVANNLHEVNRYVSLTGHAQELMSEVINLELWSSLSGDLQDLLAAGVVHEIQVQRELHAELEDDALGPIEDQGVEVNDLDDTSIDEFVSLMHGVWDNYEEQIGSDLLTDALDAVGAQ